MAFSNTAMEQTVNEKAPGIVRLQCGIHGALRSGRALRAQGRYCLNDKEASALVGATPVLPSLDIARSVAFYCRTLNFEEVHSAPREYAIVERGPVELHFWYTENRDLPKSSGCRVEVTGIDALYSVCQIAGIVHPNAPIDTKPWGTREFAILDPDGNCLTFHQSTEA